MVAPLAWSAPFDPNEKKDYEVDWTDELTGLNDTLSTIAFVLPAAALAAGLLVDSTSIQGQKKAAVWFRSTDPAATAALAGGYVDVDHTANTAAGRVYNVTCKLKIEHK